MIDKNTELEYTENNGLLELPITAFYYSNISFSSDISFPFSYSVFSVILMIRKSQFYPPKLNLPSFYPSYFLKPNKTT